MAIALQGSGDIINEWLPPACVFLCGCVELVVMTTEQEWHAAAAIGPSQELRPSDQQSTAGNASYRRSLAAALCLFIRTLSPAGTGASLAQNPAGEVGIGRTHADKQTQVG